MPVAAPIVINDGAITPVAFTFSPIGKDEKGVQWFEQTTPTPTTPLEACRIGYRQTRSTNPSVNGTSKLTLVLMKPTVEALGTADSGMIPPPTLAYKLVARLEVDMPERSSATERKDIRMFLVNALSNALITPTIDLMQPIY